MIYLKCPFCGEDDFDLIGLKYHLTYYCEIFEKTPEAYSEEDKLNWKKDDDVSGN